jgi:hypothetical protein
MKGKETEAVQTAGLTTLWRLTANCGILFAANPQRMANRWWGE